MSQPTWTNAVADHKQRQALHIGHTALQQAAEQGLSAVSMSGLATAAGVARATLYNYFPDVEAAITHYLIAQAEDFYDRLEAALKQEPDPPRRLERYLREQVNYVADADHRSAAAAMESGAVSPRVSQALAEHLEGQRSLLSDVLREGLADGSFRQGMDVEVTTVLIQRMLYAAHDLFTRQGNSVEQIRTAVTRLLGQGVLAEP